MLYETFPYPWLLILRVGLGVIPIRTLPFHYWIFSSTFIFSTGMGMQVLLDIVRYCRPDTIIELIANPMSHSKHLFLTIEMLQDDRNSLRKDAHIMESSYSPSFIACDVYMNPWGRYEMLTGFPSLYRILLSSLSLLHFPSLFIYNLVLSNIKPLISEI